MAATRLGSALCESDTAVDHDSTYVRHSDPALVLKSNVCTWYVLGTSIPDLPSVPIDNDEGGSTSIHYYFPSLSPLLPKEGMAYQASGILVYLIRSSVYDETTLSSEQSANLQYAQVQQ